MAAGAIAAAAALIAIVAVTVSGHGSSKEAHVVADRSTTTTAEQPWHERAFPAGRLTPLGSGGARAE